MRRIIGLLVVLCVGVASAADAADSPSESCDQIREQIKVQTGVPTKPNTVLLGKIGANQQCGFTSAEAYRAAWGDKPIPQEARRSKQHYHQEHDDD